MYIYTRKYSYILCTEYEQDGTIGWVGGGGKLNRSIISSIANCMIFCTVFAAGSEPIKYSLSVTGEYTV